MNISALTSPYERKARLYPALLVLLPAVLTAIAAFHETMSVLKAVGTAVLGFGGAFLFSELARDAGKKIERQLMEGWGGLPSATIFRHADTRVDAITKARYHAKLSSLVPSAHAPTLEQEVEDPAAADTIYLAWSTYIRTNARDTKRYALLFQENISYGFRRNLLGLKVFGIALSSLSGMAAIAVLVVQYNETKGLAVGPLVALVFDLVLLAVWIFFISKSWVRTPAFAYADRLAEAVDSLEGKALPKSKKKSAPEGKGK